MSLVDKITGFADSIRSITGTTERITLDEMADNLDAVNVEANTQEVTLETALSLLRRKAGIYNEEDTTLMRMQGTKIVTPSAETQMVEADGGYDGFYRLQVNGDENLVAENIKAGVNIFGIEGGFDDFDKMIKRDITNVNSQVEYIGDGAFTHASALTTVSFPNCSYIGSEAFWNCSVLSSISFPNCETIYDGAFVGCISLSNAEFPNVTAISSVAFQSCYNLRSVNFPNTTSIGSSAFAYCSSLTTVNFPNATSIGSSAFTYCRYLNSVNLPEVQYLGRSAFYCCSSLNTAIIPKCSTIPSYAFYSCSYLQTVDFASASLVYGSAFYSCSRLPSITLPMCTSIYSSAFYYCYSLSFVDLPLCQYIGSSAFRYASSLSTLLLRNSAVCTLINSSALAQTAIQSGTGFIYVPGSLTDNYKAATNWTYYASRIKPLGGINIDEISGGVFTFNQSKDYSLNIETGYGYEGTGEFTVSVASSNPDVISVADGASVTNNIISFTLNSLAVEGNSTITVTVTDGSITKEVTKQMTVYETLPEATWEVQAVSGAQNGFTLNSDGYYESTNKGTDNTYSICKVVFNTYGIYNMYIDYISDGESSYDYGIISNVDCTLSLSNSNDGSTGSTNVLKSCSGEPSTSVKTLNIGTVDSDEHFIYFKYIKDTSQSSGNDSLQFTIRMEA